MLDAIILGGGPAGLSAGINLLQRGKTALVLQSGTSLLSKAEQVDNYLGLPAMSGAQMMEAFTAHAKARGLALRHAKAGNVLPFENRFMVNADGEILECRCVILACGVSKSKPIPGESELLGRGVSYCATCDGMLYRGRSVVVWGTAENAVAEAAFLAEIGCTVTYVAAKRPDALPPSIGFAPGRLERIEGDSLVTGAVVNGALLPADAVFLLRSTTPPDALVPGLVVRDGSVVTNAHMATNLPGLFCCGDMAGRPWQVAKAVGDGLVAALSAAEYLDQLASSGAGQAEQ